MNDMLVGILGLAAIAATVISLTRGKMLPAMAFILWPSVLALAMVAAGCGGLDGHNDFFHWCRRPGASIQYDRIAA
jgi:peptidoglycan/LPS O-acetylase OafA/YrhL